MRGLLLLNKTAEVEYNLDTLGIQLKGQKKFTTTQVTNFSSPAMAELEVLILFALILSKFNRIN